IPVELLTPRPATPTPAATPAMLGTPQTRTTARPTGTPIPAIRGTPVAASEPLAGILRDDRLTSPIIGEDFSYRVYLPPDYQTPPQRRYPVLYMLHCNGGGQHPPGRSFPPSAARRIRHHP